MTTADQVRPTVDQGAPVPVKKSYTPLILILLLVSLIGLVVVVKWRQEVGKPTVPAPRATFPLSIDGEIVTWEEFDARVELAKTNQAITDPALAQAEAVRSFIEVKIITDEALSRDLTVTDEEVAERLQDAPSSNEAYLALVRTNLLKEKLIPLVVSKRSGRYLMVTFGFDRPELEGVDQKALSYEKIEAAYQRLTQGEDFETVGESLEKDEEVYALNQGLAYLTFDDRPKSQTLYSPEFTEAIFALNEGEFTEIVTLANDPDQWGREANHQEFAFAVAVVDSLSTGESPDEATWFRQKQVQLKIVNNVN